MLKDHYPYYLANEPVAPNYDLEVLDKYSGEVATRVALADDAAIDKAVAAAVEATLIILLKPLTDQTLVAHNLETARWMPWAFVGIFILRGLAGYTSAARRQSLCPLAIGSWRRGFQLHRPILL